MQTDLWRTCAATHGLRLEQSRVQHFFGSSGLRVELHGVVRAVSIRVVGRRERVAYRITASTEVVARAPHPAGQRWWVQLGDEEDVVIAYDHGEVRVSLARWPTSPTELDVWIEAVVGAALAERDDAHGSPASAAPASALLDQLARVHGFSLEELEENRALHVHPAQVRRAIASARRRVGLPLFMAALALAIGAGSAAAFHAQLTEPIARVDRNAIIAILAAGVSLASIFSLTAAVAFVRATARRRLYEGGEVLVASGPLHKDHVRRRQGGASEYYYALGGHRFSAPRGAWESTPAGVAYRVFHVAGELLSIEPL